MNAINSVSPFFKNRVPKQIVIQFTNVCNALCPQCEMRKTNNIKRNTLSKERIKNIIDKASQNNFAALSLTGGEPLLFPETLKDLLLYAKTKKIHFTRTGTNGFFFERKHSNYEKKVLSTAKLIKDSKVRNFWISIDSSDPSQHEKMRGFERQVEGIYKGIPVFNDAGIFPCANLGINRGVGGKKTLEIKTDDYKSEKEYLKDFQEIYEKAFSEFFTFVSDLGFTIANCCYPMSTAIDSNPVSPVYSAASSNHIVSFSKKEKTALFKALYTSIEKNREKIKIFNPLSSVFEIINQYEKGATPHPCKGGKDFFFSDAVAEKVFPCGFRNEEINIKNFKYINKDNDISCSKCDWECFRDPSTLMSPAAQIISSPFKGYKNLKKDKIFFDLWKNDMKYYLKCGFFSSLKK
ncbi:MAG: radical SAM protein [Desulfobacteraceae bacterium]|nr:radical SAM protein [Desulfobacteraceae bacterium]